MYGSGPAKLNRPVIYAHGKLTYAPIQRHVFFCYFCFQLYKWQLSLTIIFVDAKELKQREESLAKELENLKLKLNEIEQLAKGRGLTGILNFKGVHVAEGGKTATPAA